MSDVWVVRDGLEEVQAAFPTEKAAVNYTHGWVGDGLLSITRETLLTPEMEAVIEAAKTMRDSVTNRQLVVANDRLEDAVDALRALEGDA
jgi:hypothetical protein